MNFLGIAKRVRQECGISGDGPAAVLSQTGISAKILDWVQSAYEEIQGLQDWDFNWAEHTQALAEGVTTYDPANDWGLSFRGLVPDPIYVCNTPNSKHWVKEVSWPELRDLAHPGVRGVPVYFALRPDNTITFFPAPQAGLTAVMEYIKQPHKLVSNLDIPAIPERYHMAIVWRAVMLWCAYDENLALLGSANQNYQILMRKTMRSELPQMGMPEALA